MVKEEVVQARGRGRGEMRGRGRGGRGAPGRGMFVLCMHVFDRERRRDLFQQVHVKSSHVHCQQDF